MKSPLSEIRNFISYVLVRWYYYMTPFSMDRKRGFNALRYLCNSSYLMVATVVLLLVFLRGKEDFVIALFCAMGTVFLFTFGGILIRGLRNYRKAKEEIKTFPSMFREGQGDLIQKIDDFFSGVEPHSLDTNQGKSISNLIYVRKRSALKNEVASESFFIDLMMKAYGGKFKKAYSTASILNARRSHVYEDEIGRAMGLF